MAIFKKSQFESLAQEKGKYCISIYIPTERLGENKKSIIHLKNKIAATEKELADFGLRKPEIEEYLEPVKALLEDANIWRHLSDALVIFRNKNLFEYHTLPVNVDDFSLVSDRFYLLPLIDIFNNNRLFYILLLSQNNNRLYEATLHEITEIDVDDVFPETILDTVGYDFKQKSLQMRGEQTGAGKADAMYHGKGEGKDDKNKEIMKYLEDVDRGLNKLLKDSGKPVIVASVDDVFSHFKGISKYKNLFPENVSGNFDDNDIIGIHEKSLDILEPYFNEIENNRKKRFKEAVGKTTVSVEDIVVSADAGKIDTLFVAKGKNVWGEYNRKTATINKHPERKEMDNCLLDFAARNTFLKNGKVFIQSRENLPNDTSPVNAILRY